MRYTNFLLTFLAITTFALGFTSCSKDSVSPAVPANTLSATIEGTNYNFQFVEFRSQNGLQYVSASDGTKGMNVCLTDTAGTFQMKKNQIKGSLSYTTDNTATTKTFNSYTNANSKGTLLITKNTATRVEGTFSNAVLYNQDGTNNSVTLASGSFTCDKK
jgi:hypothetical protein